MSIFIIQGDAPLSESQMQKRTQKHIDRDWPAQKREESFRKGDGEFNAYMAQVALDTDLNRANNLFNNQVESYASAVARLERYVLSEGQAELIEDLPTGESIFNENTNEMEPVLAPVITKPFIEALPAMVDETTYTDGEEPVVTSVANPEIAKDESERQAPQNIVDDIEADAGIVITDGVLSRVATDEELTERASVEFNAKIMEYRDKVQRRLDTFAQTRDYDTLERATTYIGDDFPRFSSDGIYCKEIRSDTWAFLYGELAKVAAGNRALPETWEELEIELPVMEWPIYIT